MFLRTVRQLCTATARGPTSFGHFMPVESGLLKTTVQSPAPMMSASLTPPRIWTNVKQQEPVVGSGLQVTMELDSVMRKRKKKMKKHKLRKRRKREQAEKRKLSQGR